MMAHTNQALSRAVAVGLVFVVVASTCTATLNAQTRFQHPDTTADLSRYVYVEECLAAVQRTQDAAEARQPFFIDTIEMSKGDVLRQALPSDAIAIAQECSAKFDPKTVPFDSLAWWLDWIRLYLKANQDDAATIVEQRRLADTRQRDPQEYYKSAEALFFEYSMARPIRWTKALESTRIATEKGSTLDVDRILGLLSWTLGACEVYGDTVAGTAVANQIIAVVNAMTPTEIARLSGKGLVPAKVVVVAYMYLGRHALMDSLRRGPAAYVTLVRAFREKAYGGQSVRLGAIGQKAPTIIADFWFNPADVNAEQKTGVPVTPASGTGIGTSAALYTTAPVLENMVRPTPGKFALVVFLATGCRVGGPVGDYNGHITRGPGNTALSCWETYAILRRLSKRFPSLEITVVAGTYGSIGDSPVLEPKEEAQLMQSWWLGFHRLLATLAVSQTPFFRLSAPDSRRIDSPTSTEVDYLFGSEGRVQNQTAYLVDSDGTIIYVSSLAGREIEPKLNEMLSIMMNRSK